jgi:hypothetical protein
VVPSFVLASGRSQFKPIEWIDETSPHAWQFPKRALLNELPLLSIFFNQVQSCPSDTFVGDR